MSDEKQTPVGIILAVVAVVAVIVYAVSSGGDKGQQANNPEKPTEPEEPAFFKESLVAYYPLDGNTKDESGNGNDGEAKGATLADDRHGNSNSAYAFDGVDDFLNVDSSSSLKITGDITLSVWVKFIEGGAGNPRMISHGGKQNGWELLSGKTAGSRVAFFHGGNKHRPEDGTFKDDDSWVHILALKKESEVSLFVNGVKKQIETSGEPKQVDFSPSLNIGRSSDHDNDYFKGSIDDVRIYNRALTEEQVKALYEWEKPKAE
jgi:hypothetical protein